MKSVARPITRAVSAAPAQPPTALVVPTADPAESAQTTDVFAPVSFFAHRSGHEALWACPRRRFLNYHYLNTGIRRSPQYLHLEVGIAVHAGLAAILRFQSIHEAIDEALACFHRSDCWPFLVDWQKAEQSVLIAGLLHSYYTFLWPTFKHEHEILWVERGVVDHIQHAFLPNPNGSYQHFDLYMQSRPDAIVRNRETKEILGISWKTINDLTDWRRKQFHNDLQGLMEMHYGELLFAQEREEFDPFTLPQSAFSLPIIERVQQLKSRITQWENIPNEIDYIQTVFLVKGTRDAKGDDGQSIEDDGTEDWSDKEYRQNSPLCYQWLNLTGGDPARAWAFRHWKTGNKSYNNLSTKDFAKQGIWEADCTLLEWIEDLNAGKVFPSTLPDSRNIKNPLSTICVYDEPLYRDRGMKDTMIQQVVAREIRTAERLYQIDRATADGADADQLMSLVNEHFPQQLTSCRQPYRCEFQKVCFEPFGLLDFATVPDGYARRTPHHAFEAQSERFRQYAVEEEKK